MEIVRLDVLLDYLQSVHARTRRVVLLIPPADLEWAPKAGAFSFGDLVRHIAGIERHMYGEIVRGLPSRYPGHSKELADGPAAVVAYYDRLHAESVELFTSLTGAALAAKCLTPAGVAVTGWKLLRAMLEHEAHHRGQLYMMLALRDVTTPPIYGLTEEEVAARSLR